MNTNLTIKVFHSGDSLKTDGRRDPRKGSMGVLFQATNRVQQLNQDGRRYRRLSTYRIRILKVKVLTLFVTIVADLLDIISKM
jgi:hypothetical protein